MTKTLGTVNEIPILYYKLGLLYRAWST